MGAGQAATALFAALCDALCDALSDTPLILSGTPGDCAHPASMAAPIASASRLMCPMIVRIEAGAKRNGVGSGLWIILLEAGLALALLLFIVWWTMPRGKPEDRRDRKN